MGARILGLIALLACFQAAANEACEWQGKALPIGESVWVENPFLVESGAGRDWSGYRLQCVKTFNAVTNGNLHEMKPALVLVEHQQAFYEHVKEVKARQ